MAIIPAFPFTLTNGTLADASQVMANFNNILNSVNANSAHNGPNSDITSLTGLTTPLSVGQGGTGQAALGALGQVLTSTGGSSSWQTPNTGVTDGSNATPGTVGEFITQNGTSGGLVNGTPAPVFSIGLGAGDWDVWGIVTFNITVAASALEVGLSTTGVFSGPAQLFNFNSAICLGGMTLLIPTGRYNSSAGMTINAIAQANFVSGTVTTATSLYARRRR